MKLFVIMQNGKPFELPVEPNTETEYRLSDRYDGTPFFAFASTDCEAVEAMRQTIPDLLDKDDPGPEGADRMGLTIAEFSLA